MSLNGERSGSNVQSRERRTDGLGVKLYQGLNGVWLGLEEVLYATPSYEKVTPASVTGSRFLETLMGTHTRTYVSTRKHAHTHRCIHPYRLI
jgi:hypothetical protein